MATKTFIGFSTAQTITPATSLTDLTLIKQDITNHFAIKQGEKLENPNFGSLIPYLLFEPFSDAVVTAIEDEVERIVNFDPRCHLDIVSVQQNAEGTGVTVSASITYIPFSASDTTTWEMLAGGSIRMTS